MLLLWFVVVIGCSASLTDSLALFSVKLYFLLTAERNTFLTVFKRCEIFNAAFQSPMFGFVSSLYQVMIATVLILSTVYFGPNK